MAASSTRPERERRLDRPPGVYVEHRAPLRAGAPALRTGVPVFLGFAERPGGVPGRYKEPAVVFDRWNGDEFDRAIVAKPASNARESFLRAAVRGFFANGGERCVVLAIPPEQRAHDGLLHALRGGGPLDDRSDIDLICLPDAVAEGDALSEIQAAALAHCEAMGDRFAILDAPEIKPETPAAGRNDKEPLVDELLGKTSNLRSAFGALYFPWVAPDPASDWSGSTPPRAGSAEWRRPRWPVRRGGTGITQYVPPCGHVAGLFARLDALVGPQRSPANGILEGVVDTSIRLTMSQHALLNEGGVNCLRNAHGRGVEVGGARTLSGHSAWAYVSTTRVIVTFRRWLAIGMRDLVFEPHTPGLWDRIRTRLVSHCLELYRSGALTGADPAQAFFVKCDSETNAAEERASGRVVAEVGLAPSVPAEFIVVRVTRDADGFAIAELS